MADGTAAVGGTPFMERRYRTPVATWRVLLAAIVVLALAGIGPGTAQEPSAPL